MLRSSDGALAWRPPRAKLADGCCYRRRSAPAAAVAALAACAAAASHMAAFGSSFIQVLPLRHGLMSSSQATRGSGSASPGDVIEGSTTSGRYSIDVQQPSPGMASPAAIAAVGAVFGLARAVAAWRAAGRRAPQRLGATSFAVRPSRGAPTARSAAPAGEAHSAPGEAVATAVQVADAAPAAQAAPTRDQESPEDGGEGLRVRRLKDMVYIKEMRSTLTSSEFALRLRGQAQPGLIDYEGLSDRLCTFTEKILREPLDPDVFPVGDAEKMMSDLDDLRIRLDARIAEVAAGSNAMPQGDQAAAPRHSAEENSSGDASAEGSGISATAAHAESSPGSAALPDPRKLFYIREDQTIDFDGALTEANRASVFSGALWQRLNGREEEEDEEKERELPPEGPRILERRDAVSCAKRFLSEMKGVRSNTLDQVVKRLKCQSAARDDDPEELQQAEDALRLQLRECDQLVQELQIRVLVANIDLLLERAAAVVEADLERTTVADWDITGTELKTSVVMFSLLDKQAAQYLKFLPRDPRQGVTDAQEPDVGYSLAAEELRALEVKVEEFAIELGLEVDGGDRQEKVVTSLQRGLSQLQRTTDKLATGIDFYVKGGRILWQDLQYATALFTKAAMQAYTLKPREVRLMQRTFKDMVTLVPFIIILIIPMTPVGHVLVFSFIQKFFPDFFPSGFTERRQNVVKIYSDIARSDKASLKEAVP